MGKIDKLDFIKEDKELYTPRAEPELVEVPSMLYLMYDGRWRWQPCSSII